MTRHEGKFALLRMRNFVATKCLETKSVNWWDDDECKAIVTSLDLMLDEIDKSNHVTKFPG
jgi:hypothetical protein